MAYESRDEIDERYRWDLSSIYADDEAFLGALDKAREYPEILAAYRGKISTSAEDLLAYLRASDEVGVELGKLVNYAQRKLDEDTATPPTRTTPRRSSPSTPRFRAPRAGLHRRS